MRFPCVHAAATTPVQRPGVLLAHLTPPCQPSPEGLPGRPAHRHVRRARRSLALRPAHSRGHQFVTRYPKASDISSPPCLLRLLPAGANRRVGLAPTGKRRLVTAHTRSRHFRCSILPERKVRWVRISLFSPHRKTASQPLTEQASFGGSERLLLSRFEARKQIAERPLGANRG